MRKGFKIGLSMLVLSTMIFTACGKAESPVEDKTGDKQAEQVGETESDPLKVMYLVNGSLGDKGLFDSAAEGVERMKNELGAEIKTVEMGRDETTYESHYLDVSDQDWDLIISGTWSVKEFVEQTAEQFPDKRYIGFDTGVDRDLIINDNVMGIAYKANEGAYLAGVLAAKMLDSEDAKIDPSKRIIGFVGSMDMPGINDFLVGYVEGVESVDPTIKVFTSYVGSFEDVPKALEMTTQLYNQGAQIVYAPASQSIMGAATAAANQDKYLIACDQDLYTQLVDTQPELAANILTSTLKDVGQSLFQAVQAVQNNEMTFDQSYEMGVESGSIRLAENENYQKIVPQDIQDSVNQAKETIISGEIEVSRAFNMTAEEVAALRDRMK